MVSEKHGNFIINESGATARDVITLVKQVKEAVRQRHGVELELEICVIGAEDSAEKGTVRDG